MTEYVNHFYNKSLLNKLSFGAYFVLTVKVEAYFYPRPPAHPPTLTLTLAIVGLYPHPYLCPYPCSYLYSPTPLFPLSPYPYVDLSLCSTSTHIRTVTPQIAVHTSNRMLTLTLTMTLSTDSCARQRCTGRSLLRLISLYRCGPIAQPLYTPCILRCVVMVTYILPIAQPLYTPITYSTYWTLTSHAHQPVSLFD